MELWVMWQFYVWCFGKLPNFSILHTHHKCMSLPVVLHLYDTYLFNYSHSGGYEVVSGSLDLYFLSNYWCWAFLSCASWPFIHILWEVSSQILCLCFEFCLFHIEFYKSSLYILDTSPLSYRGFADIFTFLLVTFEVHKTLILMKSSFLLLLLLLLFCHS